MTKKTKAIVLAVIVLLLVGTQVTPPMDGVSMLIMAVWLIITMWSVELANKNLLSTSRGQEKESTYDMMRLVVIGSFTGMLVAIMTSWLDGFAWMCTCIIPLAWVWWKLVNEGDDEWQTPI